MCNYSKHNDFEVIIDNRIKSFIDNNSIIEWYNGTLMVHNLVNGRELINNLEKDYRINYNWYNPINGYLIDFVE